uniref:Uncharacterized protein n=1 Tax=Cacopsylla melanoneura TaxID=428564 RepID=A0A8D8U7A7_9HEMI
MNAKHEKKLEDNLAKNELSQIQSSVNNYQSKLENQHDKEWNWDLVLFKILRHAPITLLGPKRSEPEYDQHEVEEVAQEHVGIHISGDSGTGSEQLIEETFHRRQVVEHC